MRYYVDGYNLLFKLSPQKNSLEVKRAHVISAINDMALRLSLNIILVFDATYQRERLGIARGHYDALEIVYTENKNADNYILEEVENARTPSQITVVTSDRELAGKVRQLGAKSQSIRDFVDWLNAKKTKLKIRPQTFKDSPHQIERLRKIFEEKLKNEDL